MEKRLPETSPSPWPITRVGLKCWLWGALFGAAIRGSLTAFDRHLVNAPAAVAMTGVTLGFGVMCFYYMWRWVAGLDELQRQMQLKAFAAVFPGFLLILVGCDMLRVAKIVSGFEWHVRETGAAMLAVYGVVWVWLWWRNR
jgi:predicted membrane channel-forming protein YqfA (hemolysin III family)